MKLRLIPYGTDDASRDENEEWRTRVSRPESATNIATAPCLRQTKLNPTPCRCGTNHNPPVHPISIRDSEDGCNLFNFHKVISSHLQFPRMNESKIQRIDGISCVRRDEACAVTSTPRSIDRMGRWQYTERERVQVRGAPEWVGGGCEIMYYVY